MEIDYYPGGREEEEKKKKNVRHAGRWMTNLLVVRFRSDSAHDVCVWFVYPEADNSQCPFFAGISRNWGGTSEPFYRNDIEKREKEKDGKKEEWAEEFCYRPHNHHHNHRVRHWCRYG